MRVVLNEQSLIGRLRRRNLDLQTALDTPARHRAPAQPDRRTHPHRRTHRPCATAAASPCTCSSAAAPTSSHGRGLLLIDCDRFKDINDEHGHLVGDRVLQGVANILRSAAGPDDIACRLGGDEFCLLIKAEHRDDVHARRRVHHHHRARPARRCSRRRRRSPRSASAPAWSTPDSEWDDWYALADAALYRAKRLGGNRVEWQDDALAPA